MSAVPDMSGFVFRLRYFFRCHSKPLKELLSDFKFLRGLPSNIKNKIPMREKNFGDPPSPPKKPIWADRSRNGPFLPEGFVLQF